MFCKKCGTGIKDNQRFCPKCGTEIIIENKNNTKYISKKKKTHAIIACVCCIVLVISATIGGLVWNKKNNLLISESDVFLMLK